MRYIIIIIIILLLIIIPIGYFLNLFYLSSPRADAPTVKFIIEKGDGVGKISYKLKEGGIIGSRFWFETFVWLKGVSGNFQYGIFDLKPGMSYKKIVELVTAPQTFENQITIIEGWDLRDIGSYFEGRGLFKTEDFWKAVGEPAVDYSKKTAPKLLKDLAKEYSFLSDKPSYATLEGYLFPDTYRIGKNSSLESVARKTLDNFDKKLSQDLRDEIKKQGRTIFSVITMASIIEKEVKIYEDRQMISDIFWRRLRAYMPLQADSTINYITGGKAPAVSYADIAVKSPWNTYKNQGLPLGPIGNPGLEAIKAAIYPKHNPYWYFLTTPDGDVIYSKTLDEHNRNKAKYLK